MKNDPEYEKWVPDYLQKDFNCYNPWAASCGGCYCVKYIGATKEEYCGESWYAGYQSGKGTSLYNEKSEDSFWERKAEREKRYKEQYEESQEKKALAEARKVREAKHAWMEASEETGSNGFSITSDGKHFHIPKLLVQHIIRSHNGEVDPDNILGN